MVRDRFGARIAEGDIVVCTAGMQGQAEIDVGLITAEVLATAEPGKSANQVLVKFRPSVQRTNMEFNFEKWLDCENVIRDPRFYRKGEPAEPRT